MFTTAELFGKFHSPRKPKSLGAAAAALRRQSLHQMEALCAPWLTARLEPAAAGPHSRQRVYTGKVTFLTFLAQTLTPGTSCREAVRQVQNYYLHQPQPRKVSADNSPYCQARAKLDLELLQRIRRDLAQHLERALPAWGWTWGHPVKLLDGTLVSLPDTPENQAAYPQPDSQKPGCGFPQVRLLSLFSLDTGALLECARGQYTTSEVQLCRRLWPDLSPGDLLLGDRIFSDYTALAYYLGRGIEAILRQNAQRDHDFRRGKKLGPCDRLMTYVKPTHKPAGLTAQEWEQVPAQITVREVKVRLTDPKGRVKELVLVTTLLDPKKWPAQRLAQLLRRRWQVELHFDDLKTTLQMDRLSCLQPALIHRELEMHWIGYNLIRTLMLEASLTAHVPLDRLSFKGSLDTARQFSLGMLRLPPTHHHKRRALYREMLATIASDLVPERPGRREPRCQKRRPKAYPFLTKPRHKMRDAPKASRRKPKTHKKP
jgi:hypothetical protein